MGFYIEVPENKNKAEQMIRLHDADWYPEPTEPADWDAIPPDKALLCVVVNRNYDAVLFVPDVHEMVRAFPRPDSDMRPRSWLLMDRKLA